MRCGKLGSWRSNRNGRLEIANRRRARHRENISPPRLAPKTGARTWGTMPVTRPGIQSITRRGLRTRESDFVAALEQSTFAPARDAREAAPSNRQPIPGRPYLCCVVPGSRGTSRLSQVCRPQVCLPQRLVHLLMKMFEGERYCVDQRSLGCSGTDEAIRRRQAWECAAPLRP